MSAPINLTVVSAEGNKHTVRLTDKEYHQVKKHCKNTTNNAGYFKALVMPIRTSLSDPAAFAKDFFAPLLSNTATKVENVFLQIVLIIRTLPIDIITLPIRIITLIPRVLYNTFCQEEGVNHPLTDFLKKKGFKKEHQLGILKIILKKNHIWKYKVHLSDHEVPNYWIQEKRPGPFFNRRHNIGIAW